MKWLWRRKWFLMTYGLLIAFFSYFVGFSFIHATLQSTRPPANVTTFEAWQEWHGTPYVAILVTLGNGQTYLVVLGHSSDPMRSGPPAYVFDRGGRLVDWSRDVGDDPTFSEKWPGTNGGPRRPLTTAQAAGWFGSPASRPAGGE